MRKPLVIGICGGSGSGKTAIANALFKYYKGTSLILNQDFYYKDLSSMSFTSRCKQNFDHPDSIDFDLLFLQLSKLLSGNKVEIPQYDYTKHVRRKKTLCVETSRIIILDGTLIFSRLELVELIDMKIFIDSPDEKRLKFRQRRDVLERGRTIDSINEQYSKTVRPMYDKFVYPSKKYANIIINDPKTLDKSVHIIKKEIGKILV